MSNPKRRPVPSLPAMNPAERAADDKERLGKLAHVINPMMKDGRAGKKRRRDELLAIPASDRNADQRRELEALAADEILHTAGGLGKPV